MATKHTTQQKAPATNRVPEGANASHRTLGTGTPGDFLQRAVGNAATMRLLGARRIQPKLSVSHPEDESEREADRVADQVMRMPEPNLIRTSDQISTSQRSVPERVQRQTSRNKPAKGTAPSVPKTGKQELVDVYVESFLQLAAVALRPSTKRVFIVGDGLEYFKKHNRTDEIRRDFFLLLEQQVKKQKAESGHLTGTYGAGLRSFGKIWTSPFSKGTWMIGKIDEPEIHYRARYTRLEIDQWKVHWYAKWKIIDEFDFISGEKGQTRIYDFFAKPAGKLWHEVAGGKKKLPVHVEWAESGSFVAQPAVPSLPTAPTYGTTPISGKSVIQPKLSVSHPEDESEREADRVADQVMRMPEPGGSVTVQSTPNPSLQRTCSICENKIQPTQLGIQRVRDPVVRHFRPMTQIGRVCTNCEKKEDEEDAGIVQAKRFGGEPPLLSPAQEKNVDALRGGGRPLPANVHDYFASRFGRDFSGVRVHTGAGAAAAAREISARAFTIGSDIAFASGEYNPNTHHGRRLLAHELTHTVQQRATPQRKVHRYSAAEGVDDLASVTGVKSAAQTISDVFHYATDSEADFEKYMQARLKSQIDELEAASTPSVKFKVAYYAMAAAAVTTNPMGALLMPSVESIWGIYVKAKLGYYYYLYNLGSKSITQKNNQGKAENVDNKDYQKGGYAKVFANQLKNLLNPMFMWGELKGIFKGIGSWFVDLWDMIVWLGGGLATSVKETWNFVMHAEIPPTGKAIALKAITGAHWIEKNIKLLGQMVGEMVHKNELKAFGKDVKSALRSGAEELAYSTGAGIAKKQISVMNMPAEAQGELVGTAIGYLIPEIVVAILTETIVTWIKLGVKALKATRVVTKIFEAAREVVQVFEKLAMVIKGFAKGKYEQFAKMFDDIIRWFKELGGLEKKAAKVKTPEVKKPGVKKPKSEIDVDTPQSRLHHQKNLDDARHKRVREMDAEEFKAEMHELGEHQPKKIGPGSEHFDKYDVEIESNGHTYRRRKDGKGWCRFSVEECEVGNASLPDKAKKKVKAIKGLDITEDIKSGKKTKPVAEDWKHSPNWDKWTKRGGKIKEHPDGSLTLTNKEGVSVKYSPSGDPDFTPHLKHPSGVKEVQIKGGFNQARTPDYRKANIKAGHPEWGDAPPEGYRWHHMRDNKTMQLVPKDIHRQFPHSGGIAKL